MIEAACFWVFASVMLLAALGVILARFPVYSILLLLISMFCLAALFVLQGAVFLAALQILIYAGAILVLFLFAVMLLNLDPAQWQHERAGRLRRVGAVIALAFFAELAWIIRHTTAVVPGTSVPGTVAAIGRMLLHEYLLPFELTSFLLLAAIVGAVALAKLKIRE